jgi:uncharacterized protein YacL
MRVIPRIFWQCIISIWKIFECSTWLPDHRSILPVVVCMSVMSSIGITSLKIPTILESNDDNISKQYDLSFRLLNFNIIIMISKGLRQLLIRESVTAALQMLPETPHKKICHVNPILICYFIRDCLIIVKLRNFSHSVFSNFVIDLLCFVLHYLSAFIFLSKHSSILNLFFM